MGVSGSVVAVGGLEIQRGGAVLPEHLIDSPVPTKAFTSLFASLFNLAGNTYRTVALME